jgi:hypothetical protein
MSKGEKRGGRKRREEIRGKTREEMCKGEKRGGRKRREEGEKGGRKRDERKRK